MSTELPDHVARNRAEWDEWAREYEAAGQRNWAREEPAWGIWGVPESQVRMFPDDVAGLDVIELGCGTAYVSAWLARRGAKPVGIDNSEAQLATATRSQQEFGLAFALLHGNAERMPFPDRSFDLAIWRPYFGMHRFEWPDDDSVEFHLAHGEMIGLLRRSGFEVEDLIEIRPPDGSSTRYTFVTLEWAQRWPCEEAWKARRVG